VSIKTKPQIATNQTNPVADKPIIARFLVMFLYVFTGFSFGGEIKVSTVTP